MNKSFLANLKNDLATSFTFEIKDVRGETYMMRPFTVKEEKSLMLTRDLNENNPSVIFEAIQNILIACNTDGKITREVLDAYSLQYMFLQLRAKSAGENVKISFRCLDKKCVEKCEDDEIEREAKCQEDNIEYVPEHKNVATINVNLNDIKFIEQDGNDEINIDMLNGEVLTFVMKKPDEKIVYRLEEKQKKLGKKYSELDKLNDLISHSILEIRYKDEIQDARRLNTDSIVENVLVNLTEKQYEVFGPYFENMPYFETDIEWDCPACGRHNELKLRGIEDFLV